MLTHTALHSQLWRQSRSSNLVAISYCLTECQDLLGPVSLEATALNIFCLVTESCHKSAFDLFHTLA